MSCEYCNIKIGQEGEFENMIVCCMSCGFQITVGTINTIHKFKNRGEHRFNIVDRIIDCPECNSTITYFMAPCGGSYYFNESDVSESLLVPQEFINKK